MCQGPQLEVQLILFGARSQLYEAGLAMGIMHSCAIFEPSPVLCKKEAKRLTASSSCS